VLIADARRIGDFSASKNPPGRRKIPTTNLQ
jgi:hypothetical protein